MANEVVEACEATVEMGEKMILEDSWRLQPKIKSGNAIL